MLRFLFVYGKLKSKFDNEGATLLKQKAQLISDAIVHGKLYNIGSYPGVILSNNKNDIVHGEIYQLSSENILVKLDEFEEAYPLYKSNAEYRRVKTNAFIKNISIECYIYEYNKSVDMFESISSGNY